MPTQISQDNIQPATLAILGGGLTVTNIQITNSGYTVIDDTAVLLAGGYIKITGTNFASGCQVVLGSVNATSVTFVNSTTLNVQVPAQAAGTYVVYVVNPDGGVAIRVNGLTYSGNPTWVTGSTLPDQPANTAISIQLVASGDAPLTYAVQAGSTLPSGVALSSGGLITGSVAVGVQTLYNFTIEAIDAESQESPRAFTVTITVGDTYWDYVTTLISANTPATSVFVDDASTNNFSVTIAGDTRPNNFSPYTPGYYSNFFDGTGDYLTVPSNAAFGFGTGDFTVEVWVYPTVNARQDWIDISNGTQRVLLYYNGSNIIFYSVPPNSAAITGPAMTLNTWTHLAVVKQSGNTNLFVNGIQVGSTYTSNQDYGAAASVTVGKDGAGSTHVTGYMSNVRIVKGTAVYTANFTPSTVPLTAIANTSLLTCQSNRFIDNSTNNFTLTANGNTAINGFDPFVPDTSYSAYGSTYFDGTGDYLTVPSNAAFNITSGSTDSFSCEFWVNFSTVGANMSIIDNGGLNSVSFPNWEIRLNASSQITIAWGNSAAPGSTIGTLPSSTVPVVGQWYHIALVKTNADWSLFINGTRATTYNGLNTAAKSSATALYIGFGIGTGAGGTGFAGYISNVRIYNGATGSAPYSATSTAFAPPTQPLTAITNTSLLTLQTNQPVNNNVFIDNSTNNLFITRNGNATQGTFSPYGENWSNYFDGTGDYLDIASNAAFAFGTGNFTIECWMFNTDAGTTKRTAFKFSNPLMALTTNNSVASGIGFWDGAAVRQIVFTPNVWQHIAIVRISGTLTIYLNGVNQNSAALATSIAASNISIGAENTQFPFLGYISDFRVTNTGVYTSNFTPSTTPLLPIAGTSLLTCQSPNIVDDSANRFTITRTGDVSVQKFGPFAATTLPTPYYSGYFDGSGDYLSIANNSNLDFGTGDFTVEFWLYASNMPNTAGIIGKKTSDATNGWQIYHNTTVANQKLSIRLSQSNDFSSTSSFTLNTWEYWAVTRSGTTVRWFKNGVLDNTGTSSANLTDTAATYIGLSQTWGGYYTGCMSNVRVVKGTAVYTASFTPPTAPLTAITGTQLLTCQNNTFIDNSTNNFAITAFGNTIPSTFSPFNVTYSTGQGYTPAVFGGSMYFDGTGDKLTIANYPSLAFGTNDFTIQCWFYTNVASTEQVIMTNGWAAYAPWLIRINTTNQAMLNMSTDGGSWAISEQAIGTVTPRQWYHVAVTRKAGTIRAFLNGIQTYTTTLSASLYNGSQALTIGGRSDTVVPFNGYITECQLVNGIALYSSSFVPQNTPVTAVQNTTLLVNGTSAGVYDSSMMNNYETVGDAKIDTTVVKFTGTESMKFDGTGDSLTYIGGPSINFGTGDFTIELWVNMANTGTFSSFLRPDDAGSVVSIGYDWSNNQLKFDARNAVILNVTTTAVVANTWTHIAATRSGTSLRLFVNGTQVGATTNSTNFASATGLIYIGGSSFSAAHSVNGYISDFRITRGVARYTAGFTPSVNPFITY